MKRLIHEVDLRFFQDDATGEHGVSHVDTYNDSENPFNAGWGKVMIFHDVFEHWFEKRHKYFKGDYAMNIAGEMVAMGAMWYFFNELGIDNRLDNRSMYSPGTRMR